jgi:hypothetical protein
VTNAVRRVDETTAPPSAAPSVSGSAAQPVTGSAAPPVTGLRRETLPSKRIRAPFVADEFFGHQPAASAALPDPRPLLENLTRCIIEVLAGARELEQMARWVTDDVYRHLLKRVILSARARQATGQSASRPTFTIGSTTVSEPYDGVIEAVVIVHGRARSRAVAIRLEGLDRRWRATAINVL